jgi:hypothetical protein
VRIPVEYVHQNTRFDFVGEIDINALLADLERLHAARLRAWAVLGELRAILAAAGQELEKPARKSFVDEGTKEGFWNGDYGRP